MVFKGEATCKQLHLSRMTYDLFVDVELYMYPISFYYFTGSTLQQGHRQEDRVSNTQYIVHANFKPRIGGDWCSTDY